MGKTVKKCLYDLTSRLQLRGESNKKTKHASGKSCFVTLALEGLVDLENTERDTQMHTAGNEFLLLFLFPV